MKYCFKIEIHPCINFETKYAELYVANEERDSNKGIVVHQKHIGKYDNTELAEKAAEEFCLNLRKKLEVICIEETAHLARAKP